MCVLLPLHVRARRGPWTGHTPIYTTNGGHGMIFKTFDGRLQLACANPTQARKNACTFFKQSTTAPRYGWRANNAVRTDGKHNKQPWKSHCRDLFCRNGGRVVALSATGGRAAR